MVKKQKLQPGILIRRAKKQDYKAIRSILDDLWLAYPKQVLDYFWVAEKNGQVVGIADLAEAADHCFLSSLGVVEGERGQGIAGQLLEMLFSSAKHDIYLYTQIPSFFEQHGFVRTQPIPSLPPRKRFECEGCIADVTCFCLVKRINKAK